MKKIILHCSQSEYGNAITIGAWHRWRKFKKIGYHYIILNGRVHNSVNHDYFFDGVIETGRAPYKKGAHCRGHNKNTIGVCLIGMSGQFTEQQMRSLNLLLLHLKDEHKEIEIYQHSYYDKKKPYCAGLNIYKLRRELKLI